MYLAEGEDEKAKTNLKVSVLGLGVGGTGGMYLAGSSSARIGSAVQLERGKLNRSVSQIKQDLVTAFGKKLTTNSNKIKSSVGQDVVCEGQNHHLVSKKDMSAVKTSCERIADPIKSAYRKRTTKALTLADHRGYQGWHRLLDKLMSELIEAKGDKLTGRKFVELLKDVYSHEGLLKKFPNAIQDIERWAQKYGIYDL